MGSVRVVTSPNVGSGLIDDLKKKLDFKMDANIILLFTTSSTKNMARHIMSLLKGAFPQAKMAGCVVEGYMTREAIWTRGAAVLLIDSDKVTIGHSSGKTTEEAFSRLNREVKAEKKVVMFPMVYVPNRLNVFKLLAYDKYYYLKYTRARSEEEKKEVLREYSRVLESKSIYPANVALRYLDGEVAGMNLMPLSGGYRTPSLYVNFKECHRCCVCLGIRGKVRMHYHDVFPERGNSFEETLEILKEYFGNVELVKTTFSDIAIGEANGKKVVDFLREKTKMAEINENELRERRLEKESVPMVSPYIFAFISNETSGCSMLGLQPYPLRFYPSIFNLNKFNEDCIFTGEIFKGGLYDFYELFNNVNLNSDSFIFFNLDYNIIPMFSRKLHNLRSYVNDRIHSEYIGIISSFPSFKGKFHKKYLTEIEKGICFNGTGTSFMIEVPDLP